MHIIKLSATDSTNTYLKELSSKNKLKDFTCVVTEHQTKGRGLMGQSWVSEPSKNLIFSVFKKFNEFKLRYSFFINVLVTLSIFETLKRLNIPDLSIKWPNDIMSDNKKICGILIENIVKEKIVVSSIIGIGLNVNQTHFNNLPNASSLKIVTGADYNKEDVMKSILDNLKSNFLNFSESSVKHLKDEYESKLFRIHELASFKNKAGVLFQGTITGITNSGNLTILLDNGSWKEFDLKEITFQI